MSKCPEWLSIIYKGKMVEINTKGEIREKPLWCHHDDPSWCTDDCPKRQCQHKETWFDRTITYNQETKEEGMCMRCVKCGIRVD